MEKGVVKVMADFKPSTYCQADATIK